MSGVDHKGTRHGKGGLEVVGSLGGSDWPLEDSWWPQMVVGMLGQSLD
jgi:hypothetical protein